MRTLTIGNTTDWVWSPCGRLAGGIPPFLDTQWLTDMPGSGVYGRAFTPAAPRPCATLVDIAANHPATLYDPTVHAAILSFLNGGAPNTSRPLRPNRSVPARRPGPRDQDRMIRTERSHRASWWRTAP